MDVDMGKTPEPHRLSVFTDPGAIPTLDGWIENLMNCKQLAENDVSRLCDRVGSIRSCLLCRCRINTDLLTQGKRNTPG